MSDTPEMGELADKDDELDGCCGPDFVEGSITDDEVLGVVFGSDPEKWAAYRDYFRAVRERS